MTLPIEGQEMWKEDNSVTKICIPEHFCAFQLYASLHSTASPDLAFYLTH
jgi:hypothetical protein